MHQTQWSAERPLPPPVSLTSQSHHEKPPEVTCTSRGTPGCPASTGEGNGTPLQYSCLENPMDGGAWWASVYGVAQSWTRLKRLSS